MKTPIDLLNIRIITISGKIASGSTTLAHTLSLVLGWRHVEGGEIFWEVVRTKLGIDSERTNLRPDIEDENFDASLKTVLAKGEHLILETKLAGFNAQGMSGVFRILVVCEDSNGNDQPQIRIDRLMNREKISIEEAKKEVLDREKNDIEKWRRLYGKGNENWAYWDKKYYDLVINTYSHNQEESLKIAIEALGYKSAN